jgi:hypothetical protein
MPLGQSTDNFNEVCSRVHTDAAILCRAVHAEDAVRIDSDIVRLCDTLCSLHDTPATDDRAYTAATLLLQRSAASAYVEN